MKFSMECEVVSNTLLPGEIPILANGRTYIFYPNEQGFLSKIKIIADVPDPTKFYSVITESKTPEPTLNIQPKWDADLYNTLFQEFQELESLLAFEFDLRKINWMSPRYDLIFDSDEEREQAELFGFQEIPHIINPPRKAVGTQLQILLGHKQHLESLIVPMSFYREAINDVLQLRYINAFVNFYFVIEGLFGNRKTKNRAVEQEFKSSPEFVGFVQDVIAGIRIHRPPYYAKIESELQQRGEAVNTDAVIELLVSTRGEVQHFQNNPNRPRGTPFRHKEYDAIAFVARGVATHGLYYLIGQINQDLKDKTTVPVQ